MKRLVSIALAILVANSGCVATIDLAYLLDNGRYTESTSESQKLPQTVDGVEYETAVEPDGSMRLACFARTRQVERTWQVSKTYRYRGGYGKQVYGAVALADVIFGAATAAAILAFCVDDDSDLSCWNTLYAGVFALDMGYGGIRYAMARSPVLIDKSSSEGTLGFSGQPVHEQTTECESMASLWLGTVTGPHDLQILNGQAESAGPRALDAGSLELVLDPTRAIALTPELAERWARDPALNLFVMDRDGIPHPVAADRCALLRPMHASLSADALAAYEKACGPIPKPTEPTDGDAEITEADQNPA
ncbi:MAG TPA: hypothetical protein VNM90_26765 [Haliangium sp.]|nr:hypothetical protein [Haliangium sp.]